MDRFQTFMKSRKGIAVCVLALLNLLVWISVWHSNRERPLTVHFLDVGQGDAVLIASPTGNRVLIDGGRGRQAVSAIGRALPFGERDIDVMIATHPDSDHIGGLPAVLERYNVSLFIEPQISEQDEPDIILEKRISDEGAEKIYARRGQIIHLGGGARLTILFPDRDVSTWETNDASIVARLDYLESSFLFTGDAGIRTENILMSLDPNILDTDVLKAGHHGSRTSTSLSFAQAVSPSVSVISAGKDNSYGHPHEEVIKILERVGSRIRNTADAGSIKIETKGEDLR